MAIAKSAFEDQVLALLPSLLGVARRLARNGGDAEDLVAETVACAWRSLHTLQCEASFKGWIFRILHNTFVSEYRRRCARPEFHAIELQDEDEDSPFSLFEQMHQPFLLWFGNPEQAFLDKLLREDLERALMTLPEHHRVVVLLADLEEFTYAEIAETLGVPVGTVRSRLARARSALQKRLWHQAQAYGLRAPAATSAHHEERPT